MKAQISFDFILALSLALLLIQSLLIFSDNFLLNQEKTGIRLQEKQIAEEIHRFLLYSQMFDDPNATYEVKHQIPKIYLSSTTETLNPNPITCDITNDGALITIEVNNTHFPKLGAEEIKTEIQNKSGKSFLAPVSCGEVITVS